MPKGTRLKVTTPAGVEATVRKLNGLDWVLYTGDLPDLFAAANDLASAAQTARKNPEKVRDLYRLVLTRGVLRYGEGRLVTAPPEQVPDDSVDCSWEELPDAEATFLFQQVMRFTTGEEAAFATRFPPQPEATTAVGPDGATVRELTLHDVGGIADRGSG